MGDGGSVQWPSATADRTHHRARRGSSLAELLLAKGDTVHGLIRRATTFHTQRLEHLYRDPHDAEAASLPAPDEGERWLADGRLAWLRRP